MKIVRDNRDRKLVANAWTEWRRAFRVHNAEQHYAGKLVSRFYMKWRGKLSGLDSLENKGDHFALLLQKRDAARCWDLWRRTVALRRAESALAESVNLRILSTAVQTWKRRM